MFFIAHAQERRDISDEPSLVLMVDMVQVIYPKCANASCNLALAHQRTKLCLQSLLGEIWQVPCLLWQSTWQFLRLGTLSVFDLTRITNRPSMAWCGEKQQLFVSLSRLPFSVTNLRQCCMLPLNNDKLGRSNMVCTPGSAHLGLFRFEKRAHLQMCLSLGELQRGLRPRQRLLIGSLSRIDKEEFHSQNPNSLRGESLYHCVMRILALHCNDCSFSCAFC